MSFTIIANALLRTLIMPPVCLLLLIALAWLMRRRWPRAGKLLGRSAIVLLLVMSTKAGALLLVTPLEHLTTPLADPGAAGGQAIVVLSAGMIDAAPEYGGADVPDEATLARMQYGAWLQHRTGLPLLVSGGIVPPTSSTRSLAAMMARALREDFRTPVRWVEEESKTTAENAVLSARMLKGDGVRRVLLVTHAMHMPRARAAFVREGLEVVEAPTLFYSRAPWSGFYLIPSASGMYRSYFATHEWVGLLWYRMQAD